MKRLLFTTAIAAALGTGSFAGFRALNPTERQLSDVEMANVEALAEDETPTIPCSPGAGTCKFPARDASGQIKEVILPNMVKTVLSL